MPFLFSWADVLSQLNSRPTIVTSQSQLENLRFNCRCAGNHGSLATEASLDALARCCKVHRTFMHMYAMQCARCNSYCRLPDISVTHVEPDARTNAEHVERECCICMCVLSEDEDDAQHDAVQELAQHDARNKSSAARAFSYFTTPCCMQNSLDVCICQKCMSAWALKGALLVRASHTKLLYDIGTIGFHNLRDHGSINFLFHRLPEANSVLEYMNHFQWQLNENASSTKYTCMHCQAVFQGSNSVLEYHWHCDAAETVKHMAMSTCTYARKRLTRNKLEQSVGKKINRRAYHTGFLCDFQMRQCGIIRALQSQEAACVRN